MRIIDTRLMTVIKILGRNANGRPLVIADDPRVVADDMEPLGEV